MKQCYSNATVMWTEAEITRRESLVKEIPILLRDVWTALNPAVKMQRVETPILTPKEKLQSHIDVGFELINTEEGRGYLRPETTAGTYEAFDIMFPMTSEFKKRLPMCLWQVGCSFRAEKNADAMRATKLRLTQFYQMEFQLFASANSEAPYLQEAAKVLRDLYGGYTVEVAGNLPHYSLRTIDWYIGDLEVAGMSIRSDWKHGKVFEVAIGLDRLVALQMNPKCTQ